MKSGISATIVGHLSAKRDLFTTQNNNIVVNAQVETKRNGVVTRHNVVGWGEHAATLDGMDIGTPLCIDAWPKHRSYINKEGEKVFITDYVINTVEVCTIDKETDEVSDDVPF